MSFLDPGDSPPRQTGYGQQGWDDEWADAFFDDVGALPAQRVAALRRVEAAAYIGQPTAHFSGYEWDLLDADDAEWVELYAESVDVRIVVSS